MRTKRNISKKNRKTRRIRGGLSSRDSETKNINNARKTYIVKIFIEILNTVKLYHWKTRSFSQHKATDELYGNLNENIDKFVETLLGKDESRIKMIEKKIRLIDNDNLKDFKSRIYEFRKFLINMSTYLNSKRDSDLLNIRDEILGDLNQFLYLLTFDK